MIKTFTALLKLQLGPPNPALMKANKSETSLFVVGNIYTYLKTTIYLVLNFTVIHLFRIAHQKWVQNWVGVRVPHALTTTID